MKPKPLDLDTAETLDNLLAAGRWSDRQIAQYLRIDEERVRKRRTFDLRRVADNIRRRRRMA